MYQSFAETQQPNLTLRTEQAKADQNLDQTAIFLEFDRQSQKLEALKNLLEEDGLEPEETRVICSKILFEIYKLQKKLEKSGGFSPEHENLSKKLKEKLRESQDSTDMADVKATAKILIEEITKEMRQIYEMGIVENKKLNDSLNASDPTKQANSEAIKNWLKKEMADAKKSGQSESKGFSPLGLLERIPQPVKEILAIAVFMVTSGLENFKPPASARQHEIQNIQKSHVGSSYEEIAAKIVKGSNYEEIADEINRQKFVNVDVVAILEDGDGDGDGRIVEFGVDGNEGDTTPENVKAKFER